MKLPLLIGHRGDPDNAPENTASSFDSALKAGVDVIETDLRLSADGQLVVCHDADFGRLGGSSKPIATLSRTEIRRMTLTDGPEGPESPMFMDEALERFPQVHFNVDLKDFGAPIVRAWVDLLDRTNEAERCRTASFYDRNLAIFRTMRPNLPVSIGRFGVAYRYLQALLNTVSPPKKTQGVLQIPESSGPLRLVSPKNLDKWRAAGWKIEVWTIDNRNDMERLIDWGVDGIITNRPSLLKEVVLGIQGQ